ncbi:MAG: N(4)-(beta-N-acetylglucosaminyl)-L-asparaginase [Bacteroidota bacterium]
MAGNCARQEAELTDDQQNTPVKSPVAISTWRHGMAANARAWEILSEGGSALDAVEAGVMVTEADPENQTVGIGGRPDRDGNVTLDASIMSSTGDCGSVAALQDILHPICVARWVMERTPHVMLVGQGAKQFAMDQGMPTTNLLTESSLKAWQDWLQEDGTYQPPINIENHDTIGMLALDEHGNLSGACTTSGAGFKYAGRVGDSPIIGAGLYVDNEVGAATATGWGEAVIRACGSFLVVEYMRQGYSPNEACKLAVERVVAKNPDWQNIQVGFIALDKYGRYGGYCIQPGFTYAVFSPETQNQMITPAHFANRESE